MWKMKFFKIVTVFDGAILCVLLLSFDSNAFFNVPLFYLCSFTDCSHAFDILLNLTSLVFSTLFGGIRLNYFRIDHYICYDAKVGYGVDWKS